MKALVKAKAEEGIWLQDIPIPEIGPNDVLIKVKKSAICGTDIHIYNWDKWAQSTIPITHPIPMAVGHEFSGKIVEMGSEVRGLSLDQRVSGEGHITCGHCRNCRAGKRHLCRNTVGIGINRSGSFAEYVAIPAVNICPLSDSISDDLGAILDPLGNASHTALEFDLVGEDVLITGAGPIGIMAVAIARKVGARNIVITDVNDYRLGIAKQMGATRAVNISRKSLPDVMAELDMTEGFDVGLEMSGIPTAFNDMLNAINHGGKLALLGILPDATGIDWTQVIFKGLEIHGIYGRKMFETWYKMIALLEGGLDISSVLTHSFHIDDFQEGFDIMRSGQSGKVILDWTQD
ncbi:MAG: L-threonine 3-dehydrogenase [Emcibacter sp.]|nr:L-threonine 3-dehydrogenase [Emcibacter sp.]